MPSIRIKTILFMSAAPDISKIYISGGTIHLWTVQVTNAEYIVLRATFKSFDASPRCSYSAGKNFRIAIIIAGNIFFGFLYMYMRKIYRSKCVRVRNSVRRQRILNCRYMHTNNSHSNVWICGTVTILSFLYPILKIKIVKYFTQNLNFIWGLR